MVQDFADLRGSYRTEVKTFGATNAQIRQLIRCLNAENVSVIVREATSDYWKPFYFLMVEEQLPVILVHGKGSKERITPLSSQARRHLAAWFKEQNPSRSDRVFPGIKGNRLTRDVVAKILARHVAEASTTCPSMAVKNVSPHTLRHTCAMRLLQSGVDIATIALWLGHENIRTSGIYLHADLALKQRALDLTRPPDTKAGRYRAPDTLVAFLESL